MGMFFVFVLCVCVFVFTLCVVFACITRTDVGVCDVMWCAFA